MEQTVCKTIVYNDIKSVPCFHAATAFHASLIIIYLKEKNWYYLFSSRQWFGRVEKLVCVFFNYCFTQLSRKHLGLKDNKIFNICASGYQPNGSNIFFQPHE